MPLVKDVTPKMMMRLRRSGAVVAEGRATTAASRATLAGTARTRPRGKDESATTRSRRSAAAPKKSATTAANSATSRGTARTPGRATTRSLLLEVVGRPTGPATTAARRGTFPETAPTRRTAAAAAAATAPATTAASPGIFQETARTLLLVAAAAAATAAAATRPFSLVALGATSLPPRTLKTLLVMTFYVMRAWSRSRPAPRSPPALQCSARRCRCAPVRLQDLARASRAPARGPRGPGGPSSPWPRRP